MLWLPSPMDGKAVTRNFVYDVNHQYVVLAYLDGRSWKLPVGGDNATNDTVGTSAMGIVAVSQVAGAFIAGTAHGLVLFQG